MSPNSIEVSEIDSLAELLPAFEFDCLIARGGMGAVFKARQRSLDRDVAIKFLPRELGDDPLFRSSFQAEARAMARLTHRNLIRVYDFGDLDGLLYIVMEYVPGKSLFHSAHGKAVDPEQAVEIVIAACHGLAHAHENGIIHRDIKPANILLTPRCEPKIGDFGLARCTRADVDGLAMGTPAYMAPEIIHHPGKGDPQSDVFAMGMVLRELLTGVPAESEDAAKAVVPDLKLALICRKATHADPASRYSDASVFAGQLTLWLAAKSSTAVAPLRPASPQLPKPVNLAHRSESTGRTLWKKCAVIAFLLGAIGLVGNIYQRKLESTAPQVQVPNARPATHMATAKPDAATRYASFQNLVVAYAEEDEEP